MSLSPPPLPEPQWIFKALIGAETAMPLNPPPPLHLSQKTVEGFNK